MVQHYENKDSENSGLPFEKQVDRVHRAPQYPGHEDWTPSAPGELDELARQQSHLKEIKDPNHDREDGISPKAVPPKPRRVDFGFDY